MYKVYKTKKRYLSLIAGFLIAGLLCPNPAFALNEYYREKKLDMRPQFIAFGKYEEVKAREKEVIARYEPIVPIKDSIFSPFTIKTARYNISLQEIYAGAEGDMYYAGTNRLEITDGNFVVLIYSDKNEYADYPDNAPPIDDIIDGLFSAFNASDFTSAPQGGIAGGTMPDFEESGFTGDIDELSRVIDNLFAAVNIYRNKDSSKIVKRRYTDDLTAYNVSYGFDDSVIENISDLKKSRSLAARTFYRDTAPYYSKLSSLLRRAHWLWLEQGIGTHFYLLGADGAADSQDIREMVEGAVSYLYENVPDTLADQMLRGEMLALEKELRQKYIQPASERFKYALEEEKREFYKSFKSEINDRHMGAYLRNTEGQLEAIIVLQRPKN